MNKTLSIVIGVCVTCLLPGRLAASPQEDLEAFRAYFEQTFPQVPMAAFKDGIYALDENRRDAWETFMEFAPSYEDGLKLGEKLFDTPFKNGNTYAACFKNGGKGIRQNYPYFDSVSGKVKTLEGEINECRSDNGEKPLEWKAGHMAALSAYIASTSHGKKIDIKIPNDPRALAIYERGKRHFYAKRGQLNMSCADCHVTNAGRRIRADLLSPALGQVSHFPVWRKSWQTKADAAGKGGSTSGFGTLHRRYGGCNKQVRSKPYKAQSDEYIALEYFHTYMNNGIEINAPSLRQ